MGITAQPANATWLKIGNSHHCVLLSLHFQPFKSQYTRCNRFPVWPHRCWFE